jgi:hypothetical protein
MYTMSDPTADLESARDVASEELKLWRGHCYLRHNISASKPDLFVFDVCSEAGQKVGTVSVTMHHGMITRVEADPNG